MKLIELLDRSVSWFEFELIVKQNRWFSLTMRSHFWPLFAIFLQKMNFWSSKRCISWSNSRTNLIFDSGRIWDCILFRKPWTLVWDAPQLFGQWLLQVLLILVSVTLFMKLTPSKRKGRLAQLGYWCENKAKMTDVSFSVSLNWDRHKWALKCTVRLVLGKVNAKWQLPERVLFTL